MKCAQCGAILAGEERFCSGCGAPVPVLDPRFAAVERQFAIVNQEAAQGKRTPEQLQAALLELIVTDDAGRYWSLGVQDGLWYLYNGQSWNRANPPAVVAAPRAPAPLPVAPAPTPLPTQVIAETPQAALPRKKAGLGWVWTLLGGIAAVLVLTVDYWWTERGIRIPGVVSATVTSTPIRATGTPTSIVSGPPTPRLDTTVVIIITAVPNPGFGTPGTTPLRPIPTARPLG